MSVPVILFEAEPRDAASAAPVAVRLAGGGADLAYGYGGHRDWRAGIAQLPVMVAALEFTGGEFPAATVPAAARIEWLPSVATDLDTMAGLMWRDAPFTLRIGPEGAFLPPVVLSGTVLDHAVDQGRLTITLSDPAAKLRKPLPMGKWLGTGGIEGPVEWKGQIKRRVFGKVWNLTAEPLDKANNIYALSDPARPLQAISAVRDKGANAAELTLLAWQGSIGATFAALQAAAVPQGGGVICPSIAAVKWWTVPAGDLTADVSGEIGAGYVETTTAIIAALSREVGGPTLSPVNLAAATASRPAAVGWVVETDTAGVAEMIDALAGNVSLMWLIDDDGQMILRPWEWSAPVTAAVSQSVSRKAMLPPVKSRRIGYRHNETVMARGDIAGIVFARDVSFSDGAALSTLRPAEAGADVTATAQVTVELLTDRNVDADWQGAVSATALGALIWSPRILRGGASVKSSHDTSYVLVNTYGGTFAVDNAAGSAAKGDVTCSALIASIGGGELEVTVAGVVQPRVAFRATKTLAAPAPVPPATPGDPPPQNKIVSWSAGDFVGLNTTSYTVVVSSIRTLPLAAGEALRATATLDYYVAGTGVATRTMTFKWQYAAAGSSAWNDIGAGVEGSLATSGGRDGEGMYNDPLPGSVTVVQAQTGLSAGNWDVRLVALCSATGRVCTPSGSAVVEARP